SAGGTSTAGQQQATRQAMQQAAPQMMPVTQVDDLLAVEGFAPEHVERLREFVIVLPRATPVNVNTAPAEVLSARIPDLSAADATALVTARQTASFRTVAEFNQRLAGSSAGVPANALTVSTNFFLVNGHVSMARAGLDVQALIERNGARTNVIWVREL